MPETSTNENYSFGSDRPLLYDVEPWNRLGFAVPNFGQCVGTLSSPLWSLADEIGKAQLLIMTHVDARRLQPPSPNTVIRLCKVVNRVHQVLSGRMKEYNELRLEENHASADLKAWLIHPVPFFRSVAVRNHWLAEYNQLTMIALTNLYQHSDNNLSLTVTSKLARDVWQYFKEVQILVGMELLALPEAIVKAEEFLFNEAHWAAYDPERVTLNFESLDTPGAIAQVPVELDYRPLFEGIPSTIIYPVLKQYPVSGLMGLSGSPLPQENSAVGTTTADSAKAPAGSPIGQPQI